MRSFGSTRNSPQPLSLFVLSPSICTQNSLKCSLDAQPSPFRSLDSFTPSLALSLPGTVKSCLVQLKILPAPLLSCLTMYPLVSARRHLLCYSLCFNIQPGAYSIDDASFTISYSSAFRSVVDSAAVNGSYHASDSAGSTVQLTFFGTSVEWFGQMTAKSGIAAVYLDGVLQGAVDTYDVNVLNQQRLFAAYSLSSSDPHTLFIEVKGQHGARSSGNQVSIDAFVITRVPSSSNSIARRAQAPIVSSGWTLSESGTTGVAAMQLAMVTDRHALILDKVEHNPLTVNGHPAWGALYDLYDNSVRPLNVRSNSFCAGGTWLSNGTMLSIGGNPVVEGTTSAADFGDLNGLQALRMFNPCDDGKCDIVESPSRLRMASARWYNSAARLDDGSVMIIGGSTKGGWINNVTTV